jgi:hypothetical protein
MQMIVVHGMEIDLRFVHGSIEQHEITQLGRSIESNMTGPEETEQERGSETARNEKHKNDAIHT